jgi:hypothetical protein
MPSTHIEASFNSPIGRIQFFPDGSYMLNTGETLRQGIYAFYMVNNQELLELRSNGVSGPRRDTYIVVRETWDLLQTLSLQRVRIGARGIERYHERPISLTLASE